LGEGAEALQLAQGFAVEVDIGRRRTRPLPTAEASRFWMPTARCATACSAGSSSASRWWARRVF